MCRDRKLLAVSSISVGNIVKRADEDEHHLLVRLGDVLPRGENNRTELLTETKHVLGIILGVVLFDAVVDELPVDVSRVDGGNDLEEVVTSPKLLISERSDLHAFHDRVGPRHDLRLGLVVEELQVVDAAELPGNGEDALLVHVEDVHATDSHALLTDGVLAHVKSVVAVALVVKLGHLLLLDDFLPVNAARLDMIADLKEGNSVGQIEVKVVDKAIIEAEGVNPVAEGAFFGGAGIIIGDLIAFVGDETVPSVKDLSDEERVDLRVSSHKILARDDISNFDLLRVGDHLIGAIGQVFGFKGVETALLLVELVQDVGHGGRVGDIFAEVGDPLLLARLFKVVVDPSNEDILGLQLQEVVHVLVFVLQVEDLGAVVKGNLVVGELTGNLGEDSEDLVLARVEEGLVLDTDQLDKALACSDGLLDVDNHSHLVHAGLVLVNRAHVDGICVDKVQKLDENASI